ncbi:hypothetical protein X975_01869, partial [Stegodyphus mimosarum]
MGKLKRKSVELSNMISSVKKKRLDNKESLRIRAILTTACRRLNKDLQKLRRKQMKKKMARQNTKSLAINDKCLNVETV